MIEFEGKALGALTYLSGVLADWRKSLQLLQFMQNASLSSRLEDRAMVIHHLQVLEGTAQHLEMAGVSIAVRRSIERSIPLLATPIGQDGHRLSLLIGSIEQVIAPFVDEIQARKLFTMPPRHASLYTDDHPFGGKVEEAFPSASYDISEAAKCRALDRWTASVMHLMRALEVGLRALADHYGVEKAENWNTALNQIEARSREIGRRSHGVEGEQWAAEAAAHLRFIKNAWRNHAMHPLEKYDEERAVAIFDHVRTFMQHLAKKLEE